MLVSKQSFYLFVLLNRLKKLKNKHNDFYNDFLDQRNALISQLTNRPAWCISRQRVWGVPIPFLIDSEDKTTIKTSPEFIRYISKQISNNANPTNLWWNWSLEKILANKVFKFLQQLFKIIIIIVGEIFIFF